MHVRVHFSLCQLLIMLNYTFNTSAPLWTFLRVRGQAFPVSVNDPTSGELSCVHRLPRSPPLHHSLSPSFDPPSTKKKRKKKPPIPDLHHSQMSQIVGGLTPVTRPGLSSLKHKQTGKGMRALTTSRTRLREHTCK